MLISLKYFITPDLLDSILCAIFLHVDCSVGTSRFLNIKSWFVVTIAQGYTNSKKNLGFFWLGGILVRMSSNQKVFPVAMFWPKNKY